MGRSPNPQLRQWWRELIDAFDPGESTVAEFCRRHEVSTASFYQWRRKLQGDRRRPSQTDPPDDAPGFLKVQVSEPEVPESQPALASIRLPRGVRIDVPAHEHELLLAAIRLLAAGDHAETVS